LNQATGRRENVKKCSEKEDECTAICDNCKHYDFDDRYCSKANMMKDPIDWCEDFYCFKIEVITPES